MKMIATFKTCDAIKYAIQDELKYIETEEGDTPEDLEERKEELTAMLEKVADKFVSYGEYVRIEFDTNDGSARVLTR